MLGENATTSTTGQHRSKPPTLDEFGSNLTQMAEEHRLDPVVSEKGNRARHPDSVRRRTKNNPVLIGEPGVGKTAIVEGLRVEDHRRQVPTSPRA